MHETLNHPHNGFVFSRLQERFEMLEYDRHERSLFTDGKLLESQLLHGNTLGILIVDASEGSNLQQIFESSNNKVIGRVSFHTSFAPASLAQRPIFVPEITLLSSTSSPQLLPVYMYTILH